MKLRLAANFGTGRSSSTGPANLPRHGAPGQVSERLCRRMRQEINGEHRALAGRARDVERAAMAIDDVLDDREAKAGAAHRSRTRGVDAVEAFGEARQLLARDTVAPIVHGDRHGPGRQAVSLGTLPDRDPGDHGDLGPGAAVFYGVVEQVLEQLGKLVAL